ncbi:MAG: nitrite reductase small subunit NirD [Actinomycetota bacterium]|nr:nitrite reductase small subunit NirD [Actinomycetota bacterium]
MRWTVVCPRAALDPERGVAALLADGSQVAVFALHDGSLAAVANRDPFSGAHVMSRGIVGDAAGEPTVASPMYKQRFSLRTGRCLDGSAAVTVHPVRVHDGMVEVGSPARVPAEAAS